MKTKHILTALKLMVLTIITITAPGLGLFMTASAFAVGSVGNGLFTTYDPSGLAFNGKEIMSLAQNIFERVFVKPQLSSILTVITGIKAKEQIGFLGKIGLVGRNIGSSCAPTVSEEGITASDKFWEPAAIEDRFSQCWKDIKNSFFIWGTKNGIKIADLTDTEYIQFLEERFADAVWEAVLRIAYFGDTDAANVYDDGVITDDIDITYFNHIDGIWRQLFDHFTTSPTTAISRNAQASYANQEFVAADVTNKVATVAFSAIVDAADYRLKGDPNAVFQVTWSVWRQYQKELEASSATNELAWVMMQDGKKALAYNGFPVIPLDFWDRNIRAYEDTGSKWNKPHRILFTVPTNIAVGTEETEMMSQMETWYEKKDRTVYTDIAWRMDAKVLEEYMTSVGY